jgi:hypothetical protein
MALKNRSSCVSLLVLINQDSLTPIRSPPCGGDLLRYRHLTATQRGKGGLDEYHTTGGGRSLRSRPSVCDVRLGLYKLTVKEARHETNG